MRVRRWVIVGALILLGLGMTACGKEVAGNDLAVGDCTSSDIQSTDIETVGCDEDHTYEVFAVFDVDGDDFPGASELSAEAESCNAERFEEYVGTPYAESAIYTQTFVPTEETWNEANDRTILCYLFEPEDAEAGNLEPATVNESFEGAER
jgi:hypothetical protein